MMRGNALAKHILPPGPILSVTLIGILLLSAVIYYRAVKIERFLEPALAVTQPRLEFTDNIRRLFLKEFGTLQIKGIWFTMNSIIVEEPLLLNSSPPRRETGSILLKKLSRVFLTLLRDQKMKAHVDIILVAVRLPLSQDDQLDREMRIRFQERGELILESLYAAEPDLEKEYGLYFAATAMPVQRSEIKTTFVEFQIVPTSQLHVEVLQRFQKYVR